MSGEGSAVAAAEHAEADAVDTAVAAAHTAEQAAHATLAMAEVSAANAEESARERTAQIAAGAVEAIQEQNEDLTWARNQITEIRAEQETTRSHLTAIQSETQNQSQVLRELVERLTPPPSPAPEATAEVVQEPAAIQNAEGDAPKAADQSNGKKRLPRRWI